MRKLLPGSFYNLTTLIGSAIAFLMLSLILFLIVMDSWRGFTNPYMGLITYIGLPSVMIFGFLIALIGIIRTRRRIARNLEAKPFPVIDLNNGRVRKFAIWSICLGIVVLAFSGFGTYQAYEYTESVKFCGETCHSVMEPEYVAFQHSPHSEIGCKACHIGPGAESYVKSKLAGTQQLYALLTNNVRRPIPTPVENMSQTKETCERCHWTGQRYAPKLRTRIHYLSDELNTAYQISTLVKVGSTDPGEDEGIHSHMYLNTEVSYVATDPQRQVIPYVEMRDASGKVTIYRDPENPISDAEVKKLRKHLVNCTDCHNRPAHRFLHPDESIADAMNHGRIAITLPEIKRIAVEVLEKPYKNRKEADAAIGQAIEKFYKDEHPKVAAGSRNQILQAAAEIKRIYSLNYFPEMKASWKAHPDNLDHIHSNGCFRCHDGKKTSKDGRVISKNCQTCHLIVAQGERGRSIPAVLEGQEFKHPVDIGDSWKDTPCKDCHAPAEEPSKE